MDGCLPITATDLISRLLSLFRSSSPCSAVAGLLNLEAVSSWSEMSRASFKFAFTSVIKGFLKPPLWSAVPLEVSTSLLAVYYLTSVQSIRFSLSNDASPSVPSCSLTGSCPRSFATPELQPTR